MDELELLLIAHPGELDLVGSDCSAILSIFCRAQGHGEESGSERGVRDSGNPPGRFAISEGYIVIDTKIRRLRCSMSGGVWTDKCGLLASTPLGRS